MFLLRLGTQFWSDQIKKISLKICDLIWQLRFDAETDFSETCWFDNSLNYCIGVINRKEHPSWFSRSDRKFQDSKFFNIGSDPSLKKCDRIGSPIWKVNIRSDRCSDVIGSDFYFVGISKNLPRVIFMSIVYVFMLLLT